MKVRVTIEVAESHRAAINKLAGREGLATREECVAMIRDAYDTHLSDIQENVADYERNESR